MPSSSRTKPWGISIEAAAQLRSRLIDFDTALAAFRADPDSSESVHRIRVCSRRALAAVRALKLASPKQPREQLILALRKTCRDAGRVRDLDIVHAQSHRKAGAARKGSSNERQSRVMAQRARLRDELLESTQGLALAPLAPRRGVPGLRFATEARAALARAIQRVQRRRHIQSISDAHRLRRRLRELRFVLEFFAGAFPGDGADPLPPLHKLLDAFGALSDAVLIREAAQTDRARHTAKRGLRAARVQAIAAWKRYRRVGHLRRLRAAPFVDAEAAEA